MLEFGRLINIRFWGTHHVSWMFHCTRAQGVGHVSSWWSCVSVSQVRISIASCFFTRALPPHPIDLQLAPLKYNSWPQWDKKWIITKNTYFNQQDVYQMDIQSIRWIYPCSNTLAYILLYVWKPFFWLIPKCKPSDT